MGLSLRLRLLLAGSRACAITPIKRKRVGIHLPHATAVTSGGLLGRNATSYIGLLDRHPTCLGLSLRLGRGRVSCES